MPDRCYKFGGECVGCGECDFERRYADIFEAKDIDERIRQLRDLRKSLSKNKSERMRKSEEKTQ